MSQEQRDCNLGINPDLGRRDPLEYERRLRQIREQLEKGLVQDLPLRRSELTAKSRMACGRPEPSADEPMMLRVRCTPNGEAATSTATTGWLLRVVRGPERGLVFPLGTGRITVGRGRDDTFYIRDATVTHDEFAIEWDAAAERHCLLPLRNERVSLNQRTLPLGRAECRELGEDDQIQIGATVLQYARTAPKEGRQ